MEKLTQALAVISVVIAMSGWALFVALFLFRAYPPQDTPRKQLNWSWAAMGLQGLAVVPVWLFQRPLGQPWFAWGLAGWIAVLLLVLVLSAGGLLLSYSALRALGRQWSVVARVANDHELVTRGPFAYVRHPIYSGLYALLAAAGLAMSTWWWFLAALILFGIATIWRTRLEERLLREVFPGTYEQYAGRVPAIIPRFWRQPGDPGA